MSLENTHLDEYQNEIKKIISTIEPFKYNTTNYTFLLNLVSHTEYYQQVHIKIKNKYQPLGNEEVCIFSDETEKLLSNEFKKEILLVWLEKIKLEEYFKLTTYLDTKLSKRLDIDLSLSNLRFIGINNNFLISDHINQKLYEILPKLDIIMINKFNHTFITLIKEGFYLDDKVMAFININNEPNILNTNKENGILFMNHKLQNELQTNDVKIKKIKV